MLLKVNPSNINGFVAVPGSKSHTIRAIAGALLADGCSIVRAPLLSDDTASTLDAAVKLGAKVEKADGCWKITGTAGKLKTPESELDMGNSGTGLRMLAAAAALADGKVSFTGDESLCNRNMQPLLSALAELGAEIEAAPGGKAPRFDPEWTATQPATARLPPRYGHRRENPGANQRRAVFSSFKSTLSARQQLPVAVSRVKSTASIFVGPSAHW